MTKGNERAKKNVWIAQRGSDAADVRDDAASASGLAAAQVGLQSLDLVSQIGRALELKRIGRLQHLALEVCDCRLEVELAVVCLAAHRRALCLAGLGVHVGAFVYSALHALRRYVVLLVERDLLRAVALRYRLELADRVGLVVGVEYHPSVDVARGAARRLEEGRNGPEEALLVGVEYRHKRNLGEVEALAQEVDADKAVELALAEAP